MNFSIVEKKSKDFCENLVKKLREKKDLLVVDWYKDDWSKTKVKSAIERSLEADPLDSYDTESFRSKIDSLMNHFVNMVVQGYGWIGLVE